MYRTQQSLCLLILSCVVIAGCHRSPENSNTPGIKRSAIYWSAPRPYHWGTFKTNELKPPRDTTIDMSRLQTVRLGASLMQPFEKPPEVRRIDLRTFADTSIDMRKIPCDTLRFKSRVLGEPIKREVGAPRVRDNAAMPILTYSQEQNLIPGTIVYTTAQDAEGRMWFGTTSGLCMFDGVNSYTWGPRQGLANNSVWSLQFNEDGTLWSGGLAGLDLVDVTKGVIRHVVGPRWFDDCYVFNIAVTRSGSLLLALGLGAAILDPRHRTISLIGAAQGLRAPSCRAVAEDRSGNYWFGTSAGLRILDPQAGRIRYLDNTNLLSIPTITALHVDRHDRVWIANGAAGLWLLERDRTTLTHYTTANGLCTNDIRWFEDDDDGTCWIASVGTGGGITHIDVLHGTSARIRSTEGLAGSGVVHLFKDRERQLWICSSVGGVATLNSRTGAMHHFGTSQGLSGSQPGGVLCDHTGKLWIGSDQGIDILVPGDSVLHRITPQQLQSASRVNGLNEDSRGRIWITFGGGGVTVLDPKTGHLSNYGIRQGICENDTRKTLETPDHSIWIASITGLNRFDGELRTTEYLDRQHGLSHIANTDLLYDSAGCLWIANGSGIDRFDLRTEEIRHLQLTEDGHALNANCLLRDMRGRIWIGTNEEGIYVVDVASNTSVHLDESSGFKDLTVRSLIEDHGHVFVGMRNGLYIIDGVSDGNYTVRGYGERDGLVNTDFQYRAATRGADSAIYWCTGTVVTSLRPTPHNHIAPHTRITGIDIAETRWSFASLSPQDSASREKDGVSWSEASGLYHLPINLTLPFSKNHVTVHFTSNRTSALNQAVYQYYIEGLDSAWGAESPRPFAEYRSLPSGRYQFKVRSRNDDGVWSEAAITNITIRPPWYLSLWAYLIYLAGIVFSVMGIVRFRHATLVERQRELERTVADRTNDLEQEKLHAEHSERAKQEFLANMSHEIRTPMNAVMGLTNLLIEAEPQPKQLEYLEHIRRSSESLLIILNDILDFSKIEAGKVELESIPIDLREILSSVESTVRIRASEKSIAIECSCDDAVPHDIIGDPTRIQQVLLNLAGNAVKFTERGTVRITCTAAGPVAPESARLTFAVSDTGIGMTKDQLARVFHSFAQASTETTRRYGGTGLGLAISKQLVELMGGELLATSTPGEGSRFEFSLPLLRHSAERAQRAIVPLKTMTKELHGIRILLTEDNELNRIVARDTLIRAIPSITIDEATNGEEALDRLRQQSYDLILMDAHMPVLDGYEAASRIRMEFESPKRETPIVALTAAVVKSEIERCRAHGMNGYVAKPYRAETLITTIHRVLRLKSEAFLTPDQIDRDRSVQPAFITDLNVLSLATGGDDVLMRKYVTMYLDSAGSQIAEIVEGFRKREMEQVHGRVHQLKAHLKMMGMSLTAEIAEEIEARLTNGDPGNVLPDLIQQLARDCQHSLEELQRYVDTA